MTYKDYISGLKDKYVGKNVIYLSDMNTYKVTDVDYNGCLLIDKPETFTPDTSIPVTDAVLITDGFAWIPCNRKLPDKSDKYLTLDMSGEYPYSDVINYSAKHKLWNSFDADTDHSHALRVTHWAPLPALPVY